MDLFAAWIARLLAIACGTLRTPNTHTRLILKTPAPRSRLEPCARVPVPGAASHEPEG
jgi:hypothetical protein